MSGRINGTAEVASGERGGVVCTSCIGESAGLGTFVRHSGLDSRHVLLNRVLHSHGCQLYRDYLCNQQETIIGIL